MVQLERYNKQLPINRDFPSLDATLSQVILLFCISGREELYMKEFLKAKLIFPFMIVVLLAAVIVIPLAVAVNIAHAAPGDILRTLTPAPSGNGRALAFDPRGRHLFYTNAGDPHIYVVTTDGSNVATLNPVIDGHPVVYGALSWQSTSNGGVLWGGRFDGSGAVDEIDPRTGQVGHIFNFAFAPGDSCYAQIPGYIDGLAFDPSDGTLWLSDDNSRTIFHVRSDGKELVSFPVPQGRCNSGIALNKHYLWLGLQSGPDQPPYDVARVAKHDPTTILSMFSVGSSYGPEGLALDTSTFPDTCALWTNQFGADTGATTTLHAYQLEPKVCVPTGQPKPSDFKGVNWADPEDNYANDTVVPSGLSKLDNYPTTYAKASAIISGFATNLSANTVRLPINPYTVNGFFWRSYTGAINAATDKGFKVILSYWEGKGTDFKDGKIDKLTDFWAMWKTVTNRYHGNGRVYFEPMNEPYGYSQSEWAGIAAQWISTYSSIPRNRIFVSGTGYNDNVTSVCADRRLNGTFLSLHHYGFWNPSLTSYSGWVSDFKNRIGSCASRTVVDEWGAPMTTGWDYNGSINDNNYIAYVQADTDTIRSLSMGSVYWPGLRNRDSYSMETLHGNGTALTLTDNNASGVSRLKHSYGL
jgi:endoglucanase